MARGFTANPYEKQELLKRDIGKYVVLTTWSISNSGRIKTETPTHITLNPHTGADYDDNGIQTFDFREGDLEIEKVNITLKTIKSRKSIENFCKYQQRCMEKENSKQKSE